MRQYKSDITLYIKIYVNKEDSSELNEICVVAMQYQCVCEC